MAVSRETLIDGLLQMLESQLDAYMTTHGFVRRRRARVYKRKIGNATQAVEMIMSTHPCYAREADAHIYPDVWFAMPEVDRIACDMVQDRRLLGGATDTTLGQPIEVLAPPECRVLWFVTPQVSFMDLGEPIRCFIDRWVIGFLDDYRTPEDITRWYEAGDRRPTTGARWSISVAATYVLLNRPSDAYEVLERSFGGIHSRKLYGTAFEYVRALLRDSQPPQSRRDSG